MNLTHIVYLPENESAQIALKPHTQYHQFVRLLVKPMGAPVLDQLHAAVGISGEAGELLDAIKKVWVYRKPLDRANVVEELGDLNFYMTALQLLLGISDEEVIVANVDKLGVRYAQGYSDAAAIIRADKQVHCVYFVAESEAHDKDNKFVAGPFDSYERAVGFKLCDSDIVCTREKLK